MLPPMCPLLFTSRLTDLSTAEGQIHDYPDFERGSRTELCAVLESGETLGQCCTRGLTVPLTSWYSHALATFHSRRTVRSDTARTIAVSRTVNPPKNLNSTIRLLRASISASLIIASSIKTRSRGFSGCKTHASSKVVSIARPPCFSCRLDLAI